ncbi:hypothetical protein [Cognatilysobacter terrigena]|uniref:hypothetical protein n=1 Tax=Cognatilysobacter terrigena TaxID=2488749 RepID=UPI00105E12DB|nr:hypothetical protein [Lysobacter terrigena]
MKTVTKLLATAGLSVLALNASAADGASKYGPRGQAVYSIVSQWGPYIEKTYGQPVAKWAKSMESTFAKAPLASLQAAAESKTFGAMSSALVPIVKGSRTGLSTATQTGLTKSTGQLLGDAAQDLTFIPITPCRILDTRVAGGPIAANGTRDFDVTAVSDYSFQGGEASNCNGLGAAGSFAAVAINLTVVTPGAAGYITAYPYLATRPNAATVNYVAGDIRGNFAIVRLDQGSSANEMTIYSLAGTHVVGDVVGYYIQSPATALSCVDTANTIVSVAAGGTSNVNAPACATGYTMTATNCETGSWDMPIVFSHGGTCSAKNNSASAAELRASRTCCRVPGR